MSWYITPGPYEIGSTSSAASPSGPPSRVTPATGLQLHANWVWIEAISTTSHAGWGCGNSADVSSLRTHPVEDGARNRDLPAPFVGIGDGIR